MIEVLVQWSPVDLPRAASIGHGLQIPTIAGGAIMSPRCWCRCRPHGSLPGSSAVRTLVWAREARPAASPRS